MQRAKGGRQRELTVFQSGEDGRAVAGRVVGKGLADELYDKSYLILDGSDGNDGKGTTLRCRLGRSWSSTRLAPWWR